MFELSIVKKIKTLATRREDATRVTAAPEQHSTRSRLFSTSQNSSPCSASLPITPPTIDIFLPVPALALVPGNIATDASSSTASSPRFPTSVSRSLRCRAAIPQLFKASSLPATRSTVDDCPTPHDETDEYVASLVSADTYVAPAEHPESELAPLDTQADVLKARATEQDAIDKEYSHLRAARRALDADRELLRRERAVLERRRRIIVRQKIVVSLEKASIEKSQALLDQEKIVVDRARKALVSERASVEQARTLVTREKIVIGKARKSLVHEKGCVEAATALLGREKIVIEKARKSLVHDKTCVEATRALLRREKAVVEKAKKSLVQEKTATQRATALLVREGLVVEKAKKALIQERRDILAAQTALVQSVETVEDCLQPLEESKAAFREVEWQIRNCKSLARCPVYGEQGYENVVFDVMSRKREHFAEKREMRRILTSSDDEHLTALPKLRSRARHGKPQTRYTSNRTVSLRSTCSETSAQSDTESVVSAATSTACGTPPTSPTAVTFKVLKQNDIWT